MVGDFNYSNIKWYQNNEFGASASCEKTENLSENELKFVSALRENLLFQHVVEPTRQRALDTPHILDLIISSDDVLSEIEYLSPLGMSDHTVLYFTYYFYTEKVTSTNKFQLEKADYDKLQDFLNINWDNTLDITNTNIDEMWERFKSILIQGMNKFIPRGSNRSVSYTHLTLPTIYSV